MNQSWANQSPSQDSSMSTLREDWFIPIVLLNWGDMGRGLFIKPIFLSTYLFIFLSIYLSIFIKHHMEKNILKTEAKPS